MDYTTYRYIRSKCSVEPIIQEILCYLVIQKYQWSWNQPYFEAPKYKAQPNTNRCGSINNKYKVSSPTCEWVNTMLSMNHIRGTSENGIGKPTSHFSICFLNILQLPNLT